jgi:hypothetical protein
MKLSDFILAIAGPVSAIILTFTIAQFESAVIESQCERIADRHKLAENVKQVMKKTIDGAVTVMSFFPSVVAFVAGLMAIILTAPPSSEILGWVLAFISIALLLFIARPMYMIWSLSFYELHNRAPRLLCDRKPPGKKTYLQIIQSRLIYMNVALILAATAIFFSASIEKLFHSYILKDTHARIFQGQRISYAKTANP